MSTPPGRPGIDPIWTSSAKTGALTLAGTHSRVWFTIPHGILDEVYFAFIDQPHTRDLGLLVADGSQFFSEEKRDADSATEPIAVGVPGYVLTNTDKQGRYRIRKTVIADPLRGQMDETAFPILVADALRRAGYLGNLDLWP